MTVIDNVTRAIPNINECVNNLKNENEQYLEDLINGWNNKQMLKKVYAYLSKRLNSIC